MAYRKTPLSSANMGWHHHNTGVMHRNIRRLTSQHSLGGQLQDHDHISYDNTITEVVSALFWGGPSRILTQISGHPPTLISFFYGALLIPGIPRNNHDHWEMVQKWFPPIHADAIIPSTQLQSQKSSSTLWVSPEPKPTGYIQRGVTHKPTLPPYCYCSAMVPK